MLIFKGIGGPPVVHGAEFGVTDQVIVQAASAVSNYKF
jgi:hypothetical protein